MANETAVTRVDNKLRRVGSSLSEVCGVDDSGPRHWNRPRGKVNGRGGSIPDKYHRTILEASKKLRAGVTATDLVNA